MLMLNDRADKYVWGDDDFEIEPAPPAKSVDLPIKSYSDTRALFKGTIYGYIDAAQKDESTRRSFGSSMRTALTRAGTQTMFDALEDGGVKVESFDADQLKLFRDWQSEQSGYVTDFGNEIFKQGITENETRLRTDFWVNKSLDNLYYRALGLVAGSRKYTWRLGGTVDHCATCLENNGQTKTLKEWQKQGLPKSHELECGGWLCDCGLIEA